MAMQDAFDEFVANVKADAAEREARMMWWLRLIAGLALCWLLLIIIFGIAILLAVLL